MAVDSPVFLLATERSGTNLLRRILGSHSRIDGPSPPHLVRWLLERQHYYGDLHSDAAFERLVCDALFLVRNQLQPWRIDFEPKLIVERIPGRRRSVLRLVQELYDIHAKQEGAERWFCKERLLARYGFEIAQELPDAQFIYLHRDPRDVFRSYLNVPGGPKHPYVFAESWAEEQARALRICRSPTTRSRALRISYESLLASPRETTRRICRFIDEDFEEAMLEPPDKSQSIHTDNLYWSNLDRGIMRDNIKKYRDSLRSRTIRLIEERAYREMVLLGYRPDQAGGPVSRGDVLRGFYYVVNRVLRRVHRIRFQQAEDERKMREARIEFRNELERERQP